MSESESEIETNVATERDFVGHEMTPEEEDFLITNVLSEPLAYPIIPINVHFNIYCYSYVENSLVLDNQSEDDEEGDDDNNGGSLHNAAIEEYSRLMDDQRRAFNAIERDKDQHLLWKHLSDSQNSLSKHLTKAMKTRGWDKVGNAVKRVKAPFYKPLELLKKFYNERLWKQIKTFDQFKNAAPDLFSNKEKDVASKRVKVEEEDGGFAEKEIALLVDITDSTAEKENDGLFDQPVEQKKSNKSPAVATKQSKKASAKVKSPAVATKQSKKASAKVKSPAVATKRVKVEEEEFDETPAVATKRVKVEEEESDETPVQAKENVADETSVAPKRDKVKESAVKKTPAKVKSPVVALKLVKTEEGSDDDIVFIKETPVKTKKSSVAPKRDKIKESVVKKTPAKADEDVVTKRAKVEEKESDDDIVHIGTTRADPESIATTRQRRYTTKPGAYNMRRLFGSSD